MPASEYVKLNSAQRDDVHKNFESVPVLGRMTIKYDPIERDFFCVVWEAEILPDPFVDVAGGQDDD